MKHEIGDHLTINVELVSITEDAKGINYTVKRFSTFPSLERLTVQDKDIVENKSQTIDEMAKAWKNEPMI